MYPTWTHTFLKLGLPRSEQKDTKKNVGFPLLGPHTQRAIRSGHLQASPAPDTTWDSWSRRFCEEVQAAWASTCSFQAKFMTRSRVINCSRWVRSDRMAPALGPSVSYCSGGPLQLCSHYYSVCLFSVQLLVFSLLESELLWGRNWI